MAADEVSGASIVQAGKGVDVDAGVGREVGSSSEAGWRSGAGGARTLRMLRLENNTESPPASRISSKAKVKELANIRLVFILALDWTT